jgi:hypothetical protein
VLSTLQCRSPTVLDNVVITSLGIKRKIDAIAGIF